jgi:hypothetical protein
MVRFSTGPGGLYLAKGVFSLLLRVSEIGHCAGYGIAYRSRVLSYVQRDASVYIQSGQSEAGPPVTLSNAQMIELSDQRKGRFNIQLMSMAYQKQFSSREACIQVSFMS